MGEPCNPLTTQYFRSFDEWVRHASSWLTCHERYSDSQVSPFRVTCFDSLGRVCCIGRDFMRARDENAFPVYWLWPDQVGPVALANHAGDKDA